MEIIYVSLNLFNLIMFNNNKFGFILDFDGTLINTPNIRNVLLHRICSKFNIIYNQQLTYEITQLLIKIDKIHKRNHNLHMIFAVCNKFQFNFFQKIKVLLLSKNTLKKETDNLKLFDGVEEFFNFLDLYRFPFMIISMSTSKEISKRLKNYPRFFLYHFLLMLESTHEFLFLFVSVQFLKIGCKTKINLILTSCL